MKKINKKYIRKIDFIIIALTLVAIGALIGYAKPLIISPIDGLSTTDNFILFSFTKGSYIILDDNEEFSSPEKIYAEKDLVLNLKPGTYYWKVEGALQSEVRKLTIQSRVELKLIENEGEYDVVNSGNVPLNVSVYNRSIFTGSVVANIGEEINVSGDQYIGRQYE